jgi:hypothetical protein
VLLTRSPLVYPKALPLDLHVLSTPPAFVLSQDQTLQQKLAQQSATQKRGSPSSATTNWHKPPIPKNKLDTLLSSQKTPAHHQPLPKQYHPGQNPADHPRNQKLRKNLQGAASGPGDRSLSGPFCPAVSLTGRKLPDARRGVKSAPLYLS